MDIASPMAAVAAPEPVGVAASEARGALRVQLARAAMPHTVRWTLE